MVDAEITGGKGAYPANVQEAGYFDSIVTNGSEFLKVTDSNGGVETTVNQTDKYLDNDDKVAVFVEDESSFSNNESDYENFGKGKHRN